MTKSAGELQGVALDRNKQVISKKGKTMRQNQMPFLPEEIIFKILLLLPAEILQDVMKLVCRTWREVIRDPAFTKSHISQSINDPLFGIVTYSDYLELYSINKDKTTWNLTKRINHKYLVDGVGLILTIHRSNLYLLNPITKQIVTLPHAPTKYSEFSNNWAVGYSPSTSKYKVVCSDSSLMRAYILTVGVDKHWRELVDPMTSLITYQYRPLRIWGFMFWYHHNNRCVILLDLEKEIFYKVNFCEIYDGQLWTVLAARPDGILSIGIRDSERRIWYFWELVEVKNGGQWGKIGSIDLNYHSNEINKIVGPSTNGWGYYPVDFIKGTDEVIFYQPAYERFFVYNFKMGTVSRLFDSVPERLQLVLANSLVEL